MEQHVPFIALNSPWLHTCLNFSRKSIIFIYTRPTMDHFSPFLFFLSPCSLSFSTDGIHFRGMVALIMSFGVEQSFHFACEAISESYLWKATISWIFIWYGKACFIRYLNKIIDLKLIDAFEMVAIWPHYLGSFLAYDEFQLGFDAIQDDWNVLLNGGLCWMNKMW